MSKIPTTYDEAWQWIMERIGTTVWRVAAYPGSPRVKIEVKDVTRAEAMHSAAMNHGYCYADTMKELESPAA